jgi:hypothetical protein
VQFHSVHTSDKIGEERSISRLSNSTAKYKNSPEPAVGG